MSIVKQALSILSRLIDIFLADWRTSLPYGYVMVGNFLLTILNPS